MSKIKLAVIGVGSLGQHHARILSTHENAELIGVVDADAKRGETIAKKCNTASFTDVKEVMDKIQAAVISVPTPYHYDIAKQLLQAGIHCLVEKPFTETVEQSTSGNGHYYNLNGQRVMAPSKGLYIINGKRVVIK